ncbi:quinon protein alcohol dehydrogenase-like superfamily [Globomyces pollinis-pini]|nr:quinon protein alcohol dehydrogenase-like superfamily [Globomyces pollinis-pini]
MSRNSNGGRTNRRIELDSIIGITTNSPAGLGMLSNSPVTIYPAGAALVLYNYAENTQSHIQTPPTKQSSKPISCVAITSDNTTLAVGESGHQPRILVYNIVKASIESTLIGHKYGVLSVNFTSDKKYLISCGFHHDGYVYVWDWKTNDKIAGVKLASRIHSLAINPLDNTFATGGVNHCKFWDIPKQKGNTVTAQSKCQTLEGKSAIMDEHRGCTIADLVYSNHPTYGTFLYGITTKGIMLVINQLKEVEKWVDMKMARGSCIEATENFIICGGADGKIRLFEPYTLKHLGNFSMPDSLLKGLSPTLGDVTPVFPEVMAIKVSKGKDVIVTIVFSNKNIMIYDLSIVKCPIIIRNLKFHSDCIWGIQRCSNIDSRDGIKSNMENGFVTYSSDGTVKFWESESLLSEISKPVDMVASLLVDSTGLLKFRYIDRPGSSTDIKSVTEKTGVKAIAINVESNIIACGDRTGLISLFLFDTFEKIGSIDAHDSEVMVLDFARVGDKNSLLLASASRDRLIHIFDANRINEYESFDLIQTLDDHSSTLTAMKFADNGRKLISCGADKAVIFRALQETEYVAVRNTPMKSSVYDMSLSEATRNIVTISQDRKLTFLDMDTGKPSRSYSPTVNPLDPSMKTPAILNTCDINADGNFVCAGASDKTVQLIDSINGISLGKAHGHGDLITGIKFINNGSHIISTSADGCIFIWKLSDLIQRKMGIERINNINTNLAASSRPITPYISDISSVSTQETTEILDNNFGAAQPSPISVFKYEEQELPIWARKSLNETAKLVETEGPIAKGRWAERIEGVGVTLFSDVPVSEPPVAKFHRRYSAETTNVTPSRGSRSRFSTSPFPQIPLIPSNSILSIHKIEESKTPELKTAVSHESLVPTQVIADEIESDSECAIDEILCLDDLNEVKANPDRKTASSLHYTQNTQGQASSKYLSALSSPDRQKSIGASTNQSTPISISHCSSTTEDAEITVLSNNIVTSIEKKKEETQIQVDKVRLQLSAMGIDIPANGFLSKKTSGPVNEVVAKESPHSPERELESIIQTNAESIITQSELALFEKLAEKTANSILHLGKSSDAFQTLERVKYTVDTALGKGLPDDRMEKMLENYSNQLVALVQEKLLQSDS